MAESRAWLVPVLVLAVTGTGCFGNSTFDGSTYQEYILSLELPNPADLAHSGGAELTFGVRSGSGLTKPVTAGVSLPPGLEWVEDDVAFYDILDQRDWMIVTAPVRFSDSPDPGTELLIHGWALRHGDYPFGAAATIDLGVRVFGDGSFETFDPGHGPPSPASITLALNPEEIQSVTMQVESSQTFMVIPNLHLGPSARVVPSDWTNGRPITVGLDDPFELEFQVEFLEEADIYGLRVELLPDHRITSIAPDDQLVYFWEDGGLRVSKNPEDAYP